MNRKNYNLLLVLVAFTLGLWGCGQPTKVTIANPYADVNWDTFGQFKTALHMHSTNSDGQETLADVIETHFRLGFDIIANTDHNYLTRGWDQSRTDLERERPRIPMTADRRAEIEAGVGRDGRGMIGIDNSIEHSYVHHVNSFFADFTSNREHTLEEILTTVESLGGLSRLNHLGRYTRAFVPIRDPNGDDAEGIAISKDPEIIAEYVDLFMSFPSLVGTEIVNRLDDESAGDRILWDGILMQTMPQNRPVWGFANDDSHGPLQVGYAWNVFLMPSLSQEYFRTVMETGAFYAVSRVSHLDGINRFLPDGTPSPRAGNAASAFMLSQPTPSIVRIDANEHYGTITIIGSQYNIIEWIADGIVIATGNTLYLFDHQNTINSYVRAQLKSNTGIAFTQPFGIQFSSR